MFLLFFLDKYVYLLNTEHKFLNGSEFKTPISLVVLCLFGSFHFYISLVSLQYTQTPALTPPSPTSPNAHIYCDCGCLLSQLQQSLEQQKVGRLWRTNSLTDCIHHLSPQAISSQHLSLSISLFYQQPLWCNSDFTLFYIQYTDMCTWICNLCTCVIKIRAVFCTVLTVMHWSTCDGAKRNHLCYWRFQETVFPIVPLSRSHLQTYKKHTVMW